MSGRGAPAAFAAARLGRSLSSCLQAARGERHPRSGQLLNIEFGGNPFLAMKASEALPFFRNNRGENMGFVVENFRLEKPRFF